MNLFKWYLLIVFEYWTTFVIERASHATWLVAVMSQTNHESNNNTSRVPIQKRCWSKPDDISTEFLALFSFIPYKTRLSCCFSSLDFVFLISFSAHRQIEFRSIYDVQWRTINKAIENKLNHWQRNRKNSLTYILFQDNCQYIRPYLPNKINFKIRVCVWATYLEAHRLNIQTVLWPNHFPVYPDTEPTSALYKLSDLGIRTF